MKRPTELIEMLDTFPEIKLNHGDAEKIYDWINHLESQLQPRKTVSDAVDYFGEDWCGEYKSIYEHDDGSMSTINHEPFANQMKGWRKVCTREEFEAEVERRKGEESIDKKAEWYAIEVNKLFKAARKDGIKLSRTDHGTIWEISKPTLSKDEAWDKAVSEDVSPFYILENYEVK